MADLDKEREWMRQMASAARQHTVAETEQATDEQCPDCGHGAHWMPLEVWGSGIGTIASAKQWFWCANSDCVCHIDPCVRCGVVSRPERLPGNEEERCPNCGHVRPVVVYA